MTTLYLVRHAKSSWDDPDLRDRDRPLAPRGARAARQLAGHSRRERIAPDLVLCSSARRAVETLEIIAPAFAGEATTSIEDELYAAGSEELAHRLHELPESVSSAMLIGHNPGLQQLALVLVGHGDRRARDRIQAKLPTGALVTLDVPPPGWRQLGAGYARLLAYVTPKDLEGLSK
jgi:phosphohistidine phosphatase